MPLIMQIKDLRNTTEISNMANREQEILNGAEAVDADVAFAEPEKKHFG